MADGTAPEEGNKKRKLSHLKPSLRKKIKQQKAEELTPEEKQRRNEQKRRRDLALKLRAEGRGYDPKVFKKKKESKSPGKGGGGGAAGAGSKHKKAKVKIKSSQRDKAPYHVIILPIAWHQRKEESQRILDASEKAQQLLTAAGLTCRIDDGDKFTPGQKMKYWELRGVKVRLEIGPKESLAGSAVLAVQAAAPGQVAQKSSVKVAEPMLSQRVKAALQKLGAMDIAAERDEEGDAKAAQQQQESAAGSKRAAAEEGGEEQAAEEQQQHKKQKKKHKQQQEDAAAGAAAGDVQADEEGSSKAGKKKKPKETVKEPKKSKDQLKSQLASLVEEQQLASSIADQVMQEAAAEAPQQQQQQQHLARVQGLGLDQGLGLWAALPWTLMRL